MALRGIVSRIRKSLKKNKTKRKAKLDNESGQEKRYWNMWLNNTEDDFVFTLRSDSNKDGSNQKGALSSIKRLSLEDMNRFGSTYETGENWGSNTMLCINCGHWTAGQCYKHPLVFVKEKIPKKAKYLATSTLPPFFYLQKSTIPNAGTGIFTRLPLPAGIAFGPYTGVHTNDGRIVCSRYSWEVGLLDGLQSWIDAENMRYSNWMRWVNCPRSQIEQNMVAMCYYGQIYYYTYKPIEADSELMVWYGSQYGKSLKVPNAEYGNGPLAPTNFELHDADGNYIGVQDESKFGTKH